MYGWPTHRRHEAEITRFFQRYGAVRSCYPWHSASAVRVEFSRHDDARAAVAALDRSHPDGFDSAIELKPVDACPRCEELRREIERLKRSRSRSRERAPKRGAGPPTRPRSPPANGNVEGAPPKEVADEAIRTSPPNVATFLRVVQSFLGDRAVIHVSHILPPDVRTEVVNTCDKFICVTGEHHSVPNRKEYVYNLRRVARAPGVITSFFEWTGFRLVFFVQSRQFDKHALRSVIKSARFEEDFGKFAIDESLEYIVS